MNWKTATALVVIALLAVLFWSIYNKRKWIEKDVAMQVQIAQLMQRSDKLGQEAVEHGEAIAEAETKMRGLEADKAKAAASAAEWRKRYMNRKPARTRAQCKAQLEDCDTLVQKLDETLIISDQAIFACNDALGSCHAQVGALTMQVQTISEAKDLEAKRVETWQQQTRKGRVKTAFLAIGSAAAGGLIGYGAAAATK